MESLRSRGKRKEERGKRKEERGKSEEGREEDILPPLKEMMEIRE